MNWTRESRALLYVGLALMASGPLEVVALRMSPWAGVPFLLLGAVGMLLANGLVKLESESTSLESPRGTPDGNRNLGGDMEIDELLDPPPTPAEIDGVEAVLRKMRLQWRWKRVVSEHSGRQSWALEVRMRRGAYDVVPQEGETWTDAITRAGLT